MNDGNYHHVKVIKSANKIAVLIDGTEVCSKELDASTLASYFTKMLMLVLVYGMAI